MSLMTASDIIGLILAIGFIIIAVCVVFVTVYFIKALKSITSLADSLQNTTENIREKIQNRFLSSIPAIFITLISGFIGRFLKRGR